MTTPGLDALEGPGWFSTLSPDLRAALIAAGRVRRAKADARIYAAGEPPTGLFAVLTGEVRLISYPELGARIVSLLVGAGEWFGELSTLDGGPRPQDAVAAEDTVLLQLSDAALERAGSAHPELWRAIGVLACRHQRRALDYIGQLLTRNATGRMAALLCGLRSSGSGEEQPIRMGQEELAAAVGLSRQTANATLRDMQANGLVRLGYGTVLILDAKALGTLRDTRDPGDW